MAQVATEGCGDYCRGWFAVHKGAIKMTVGWEAGVKEGMTAGRYACCVVSFCASWGLIVSLMVQGLEIRMVPIRRQFVVLTLRCQGVYSKVMESGAGPFKSMQ